MPRSGRTLCNKHIKNWVWYAWGASIVKNTNLKHPMPISLHPSSDHASTQGIASRLDLRPARAIHSHPTVCSNPCPLRAPPRPMTFPRVAGDSVAGLRCRRTSMIGGNICNFLTRKTTRPCACIERSGQEYTFNIPPHCSLGSLQDGRVSLQSAK